MTNRLSDKIELVISGGAMCFGLHYLVKRFVKKVDQQKISPFTLVANTIYISTLAR
jgi:hypothetical protein